MGFLSPVFSPTSSVFAHYSICRLREEKRRRLFQKKRKKGSSSKNEREGGAARSLLQTELVRIGGIRGKRTWNELLQKAR